MMMLHDGHVIGINQWLCPPKVELNTKNSTKWQLEFLVFNSINLKKTWPFSRNLPVLKTRLVRIIQKTSRYSSVNTIHWKKSDPAGANLAYSGCSSRHYQCISVPALIIMYQSWYEDDDAISTSYLSLLEAQLSYQNSTKWVPQCDRVFEFLVLNSI